MSRQEVFNRELLKVARQARSMSQSELAKAARVSQGVISKVEGGVLTSLSDDVVGRIADALDFPRSLFFEADRVYGLPVSMQYRKKASVGQRAIDQLEAETNLRLMHLRRLLRSVDLRPELDLPRLDIDEFGGDPEHIAGLVRRMWLIPSGPLRDLTDYVERAGCVVFHCDFQQAGVDGLTLRANGLPTCVFLNSALPGDRLRFTLAHELAHIVMHSVPTPDMESEADRFAAALLMPAQDIRSDLTGRLSLGRLAALKPIWRVAMSSLLYRASTLKLIGSEQSQYLWRQMSVAGYRKREPAELDFPLERPAVLLDMFRAHQDQLGYSVEELATALHLSAADLMKWHTIADVPARPHGLRLVK